MSKLDAVLGMNCADKIENIIGHSKIRNENRLTLFYSPHATSVDNEAGRASGHADVPLSELGRRLAREIGQYYATEAIDAVFCSDLQRASSTAEIAYSY